MCGGYCFYFYHKRNIKQLLSFSNKTKGLIVLIIITEANYRDSLYYVGFCYFYGRIYFKLKCGCRLYFYMIEPWSYISKIIKSIIVVCDELHVFNLFRWCVLVNKNRTPKFYNLTANALCLLTTESSCRTCSTRAEPLIIFSGCLFCAS